MHQFIDIKHHHKILTVCLLLIFAILITFQQVKNFDFVNLDDLGYVAANPKVQSGLTIDSIAWAFSFTDIAYWHPLTWLSHMLDCELYGLNPMGHHWTNLQIHITNTLLLFFMLQKISGKVLRRAPARLASQPLLSPMVPQSRLAAGSGPAGRALCG